MGRYRPLASDHSLFILTTVSRRLIVVAASLVITLIAGVAIASSHASGPPDDPGVPRFLDGEDLPPGLEGKVPLPPGLEMKAGSWTPPGQAGRFFAPRPRRRFCATRPDRQPRGCDSSRPGPQLCATRTGWQGWLGPTRFREQGLIPLHCGRPNAQFFIRSVSPVLYN